MSESDDRQQSGNEQKRADKSAQHSEETDALRAETQSESNKCPECDEPIDNLRAACPNCGYEYTDGDYDDKDAGSEFRAGSEVGEAELGEKVKEAEMDMRHDAEDRAETEDGSEKGETGSA